MNILIIGSGGREYAIALKLKSEKNDINLYFAPGNGATSLSWDLKRLLARAWWISLKKRACSSLDQAKQQPDLKLARPI